MSSITRGSMGLGACTRQPPVAAASSTVTRRLIGQVDRTAASGSPSVVSNR
jgi:hypothetical protein